MILYTEGRSGGVVQRENLMTDYISGDLQRLLDEVLMTSEFAWWEWDILRNVTTSNDLKVTMLGYDPEDFRGVAYQAYTELLHPADYERVMQAMRDHLEGRAPIYQIDYRIRRADGAYVWYMDRGQTIARAADGSPLRLRGFVLDLGPEFNQHIKSEMILSLVRRALPSSQENRNMVTLCSGCKQLKLEEGIWMSVDSRFQKALTGSISHGLCPECIRRLYPESVDELN